MIPETRQADKRDEAVEALRALTRGPKGDRSDYVGHISTAHATILVELLDRIVPLYDANAWGKDELRYLQRYRWLTDEGRAELNKFAAYLAERFRASLPVSGETRDA